MTLAAILYRHLGQSVPAVPELSRLSGTTETIAPQPVPVVPAVPEENQGNNIEIDRQRTFLKRDPLVTEADLSRLQKQLLPHLAECRDCAIEPHSYCATAEADGWAYQCLLTDCEDADQLHAVFVGDVIRARICGLSGVTGSARTLKR